MTFGDEYGLRLGEFKNTTGTERVTMCQRCLDNRHCLSELFFCLAGEILILPNVTRAALLLF